MRGENKETLKIICGKGIREKAIELLQLTFGDGIPNKYKNFEEKYNVEFVELENGQAFENESFKITAYDLEHGTCKPIMGYVLEKEGNTVGYATDTIKCDNVKVICQNANIVFLDATNTMPSRMHMGVNEVVEIAKEFPNTKIYAIHRSDYDHSNIAEIAFPEDGEIIEL